MLILQDITYTHPNRDLLFANINLFINKHDKVALIGNNGVGKSSMLKILSGSLLPSGGYVKTASAPYYIPQIFGQFNDYTIAQALKIGEKLKALHEILNGQANDANLTILDDDWSIEERCKSAFSYWKLDNLDLNQKMSSLSGGQKTKIFLAGIQVHRPEIVLLDEPSNHLDTQSREILYNYVTSTHHTLVVVSHDRTLLNLFHTVYELDNTGITAYGGNYAFYTAQKQIECESLQHELKNREKALRKAKDTERAAIERQQKMDARGKKKQEKAGLPTISMNTLKNNAEKSTSKMKGVHAEKVGLISKELTQLRTTLPAINKMKMDFDNSILHTGKVLITAKNVNFGYDDHFLWLNPLNFQIKSGERFAIKGQNGAGKSTLIKLMLDVLKPTSGTMEIAVFSSLFIDQDYSLIEDTLSVYDQAQQYNSGILQEHEIKIILNRFLFTKACWDKSCNALSGGEKMRLMLCSLIINQKAPDLIILDEPTNNLDIQNIEILTNAVNDYRGTVIVISHDTYFLNQINIKRTIDLS